MTEPAVAGFDFDTDTYTDENGDTYDRRGLCDLFADGLQREAVELGLNVQVGLQVIEGKIQRLQLELDLLRAARIRLAAL